MFAPHRITSLTASLLASLAIFFCSIGSASADYLPEGATQNEQVDSLEIVGSYLSSPDFILSRLELRKYSADVVADLVDVVDTRRFGKQARSRALQSLALYAYEDARAKDALRAALDTFKPGHPLCPTAVISYAEGFGEEGVFRLAPLGSSSRADVRMAVVVALGRFGGQSGYEKLVEMAETEKHEAVRARLESYIQ